MAKILVIDDEENNRLLLSTLLKHAGHSVIEAATGAAGVELTTREEPDAIVVDLSLPDISGPDLLRRLRADPHGTNAAIALYTATRLAPAIDELIEIYAIGIVIPKPGDPREILAAFDRLLS